MKIRSVAAGLALATGLALVPAVSHAAPALPTCTDEAIATLVTPVKCTWTVVYSNGPVTTYILDTNGKVRVDYKNSTK